MGLLAWRASCVIGSAWIQISLRWLKVFPSWWVMTSAWHTWTWKNKNLHILTPQGQFHLLVPPPLRLPHKDPMLLSLWVTLHALNTPCTFKCPFLPPWAHNLCCLDAHSHPTESLSACWWPIYFFKFSPDISSSLHFLLNQSLPQEHCFHPPCRFQISLYHSYLVTYSRLWLFHRENCGLCIFVSLVPNIG